MALVPPPATAIMLKKKEIYGHPEEGILYVSREFSTAEQNKPTTVSYNSK
jgi:hypothetical protein